MLTGFALLLAAGLCQGSFGLGYKKYGPFSWAAFWGVYSALCAAVAAGAAWALAPRLWQLLGQGGRRLRQNCPHLNRGPGNQTQGAFQRHRQYQPHSYQGPQPAARPLGGPAQRQPQHHHRQNHPSGSGAHGQEFFKQGLHAHSPSS